MTYLCINCVHSQYLTECGIPNSKVKSIDDEAQLTHANVSKRGRYPWMAYLLTETGGGQGFVCGSAIINDLWILTAAHCIDGSTPQNLKVYVNVFDTNMDTRKPLAVSKVIKDPNYRKANTPKPQGDLGLIRLKEPLKFGPNEPVAPICIESTSNFKEFYGDLYLTGWGKVLTPDGKGLKNTNVLHEGSLKQLKTGECKRVYRGVDGKEQICAGDVPGDNVVSSATQQGDSGSPLSVIKDGKFFQVGLTSYGLANVKEAIDVGIGVFERTNSRNNWKFIKDNVKDGKWCK